MSGAERRPRILIADDFATMREVVVELLAEFGFDNTVEVGDAGAALSELERARCDLLIADCDLPDMSGIELFDAVRARDRLRSLPVLLMVTETQCEQVGEALRSNVDGYIVKPFTARALRERLERIFKRARCAA